jgi:hypothetical protein
MHADRFLRFSAIVALVQSSLGTFSVDGHADERERCARASEHAQDLRSQGKLKAAREELLSCVPTSCPAVVRTDCLKWFSEVDAMIPSIIVSARDPAGHDAIAVRVFVDGELFASALDGKAMFLDPGAHALRFEYADNEPVEETVLIREAQKERTLDVQFKPKAPLEPQPPRSVEPGADRGQRRAGEPPFPVLSLVLAAVGVAGLGAFLTLGITGQSEYDHCNQRAAPCTQSDIDSLGVKRDVAWALGAVGVVSLGVATWYYVSRPSAQRIVGIGVREVPGGGLAEIRARF